jgi:hypothetical protein
MALAYEVRLFERCSGNVISTYVGIAPSKKDAMVRCVERCKKLTADEERALVAWIKYGVVSRRIDPQLWAFSVQTDKTL